MKYCGAMRLKSLEMVGFKSFAHRTILHFNPGITAIVGPNGCGKSNIVDALRWVMGEQSPRHLRGREMEDVIFNGSESQAPLGMAEVSLILDNEDGRAPAGFEGLSEIMVTRRLFRSGESEYLINKVPCRLRDIVELFLGTGVGNKAYSIIEQGRIEEIVNAKPEERRALIEEAAGISKYKSRKLIAERKLERTQENLLRVSDILREIERQIRSLELQAKKAERFKALKEELKQKEVAWAWLQRRQLEAESSKAEAALRELEDRLLELNSSLHSSEAESEAVRLTILETEREIAARQEALYQLRIENERKEQELDFYRKDRFRLDEAETKLRSELSLLESRRRQASLEIEELRKAAQHIAQLALFEEASLHEKEEKFAGAQHEIQNLESELERGKAFLIEVANEIAHLKNRALELEKQSQEIQRALARVAAEKAEAFSALESSAAKLQEKSEALEVALKREEEIGRESKEIKNRVEKCLRLKQVQEKKIGSLKEKLQQTRSLLTSLEDLVKNYQGYEEGVRAIMLQRRRGAAFDGVYGLVAEVIEAPRPYEKALTAVLGGRLQWLIVGSYEEGLEAIEFLKRESSGRGSFIPCQPSQKSSRPLPVAEPEVIAPLLDLVSVKDGFREVAEYLLGDVVMVRDLKAALALWSRNGFVSTLVTPDGEVLDSMGVVTGGSAESLEGSLLAQRRRMKELEALLEPLEEKLRSEERELAALGAELSQADARRGTLNEESQALAVKRVRLEQELAQAQQEIQRLKESLEVLAQEEADLSSRLGLLEEEREKLGEKIDDLLKQKSAQEYSLAQKQPKLSELKGEARRLETEAIESRIRSAALGERKEHAQSSLEDRMSLERELSQQIRSGEVEGAQIRERKGQLEEAVASCEASLRDGKKALKDLEEKLAAEREKYREGSLRLAQVEETIRQIRPLLERAQEEKTQLQLLLSEKRLKLDHLVQGIREKYDVDLGEVEIEAAEPADDLQGAIEELRGRLERVGEVNLAAIGEFEELSGRYQFLSQQKGDLEKSIADLQRTIAKLNRVSRLRFRESFAEINGKFQETFPRLFRGGKARLVLTDENDYLETGVEIVAQPPGKKLQSISLLSGGEKALTAVSLLFAIFLTKPSPFCFLDEVDAPLDDANIGRFNEMVREMSSSSQFILITHNKGTMQSAAILYGITMEEPGVSKVVSVKLS